MSEDIKEKEIPAETENLHEDETQSQENDKSKEIVNNQNEHKDCSEIPASSTADTSSNQSEKATECNNPTNSEDEYAKHVTYTEDGSAIYTDPKTNYKYRWCEKTNSWVPCEATNSSSQNDHYSWCEKTQKWIPKTETEFYKWDAEKNEWIPKASISESGKVEIPSNYEIDENGQRTYTDKDGVTFFWDETKNAWFPKIDDDFMAQYQMNYGFIDNTSAAEAEKRQREAEEAKQKEEELKKMTEEAKAAGDSRSGGVKRKAVQEPPSKLNNF